MITESEMTEMTETEETDTDTGDERKGDELENWEGDSVVHHGEIVTHEEANRALSVNGNAAAEFYAKVGAEVAAELRSAATDAKLKMLDSRDNAIEAGRILNRVRGLLSDNRGQFTDWLKAEFGKTDRTARNLMSLATVADEAQLLGPDTSSKVLALPMVTLYKLGAETLPDEDRSAIIEGIDQGEYEDASDVMTVINERKSAEADRRGGTKDKKEKAATGDEGDGAEETFQEKKEKYATALRRHSAFLLASGIVTDDEGEKISVGDIVSLYGEIRKKLTAEDHEMISEMLFAVAKAFQKGGMDAVNALKPIVPEEPVSKAKAKKKAATGGDD